MKKRYWTTNEGDDIPYGKIENSHLINILKWIERRADKGMKVEVGGGFDPESFWYDSYDIIGDEVLEKYDYEGLKQEALKRKLIK